MSGFVPTSFAVSMRVTGLSSATPAELTCRVVIPDVMVADLSSGDQASYLGFETGGATGGSNFGILLRVRHDRKRCPRR